MPLKAITRGQSATKIVAVTPADSDLANGYTDGILLDADGTVNVTFPDGTEVNSIALAGKVIHPIRVSRIRAIGTATTVWAAYADEYT